MTTSIIPVKVYNVVVEHCIYLMLLKILSLVAASLLVLYFGILLLSLYVQLFPFVRISPIVICTQILLQ